MSISSVLTKPWSRRYFVVIKDKIKWYKSDEPNAAVNPCCGWINFEQIMRIRVLNTESRLEDTFNKDEYGTYSLEIDSKIRNLIIRTDSLEAATAWVKELRRTLEHWTGRTGRETLREMVKPRASIDRCDYLIKKFEEALEQEEDNSESKNDAGVRNEVKKKKKEERNEDESIDLKKKKKKFSKLKEGKQKKSSRGTEEEKYSDDFESKKVKRKNSSRRSSKLNAEEE